MDRESAGVQAVYSAVDFETAVTQGAPRTAVFDCDGTLWSGDAGYGFMIWSMAQGLVSRNACDWIDSRYRQYLAGQVSELEMCGEMTQLYCGLREDELRAAARTFFRAHVQRNIFPEMASLVETLRSAGVELWAVSSTNNWVIEEGVSDFGIGPERILSARVRVAEGIATSDLIAVPTDEHKASALIDAGLAQPDAVFGNSIHDAAMLSLARNAYPVNPTPALLERAEAEGWPVFYPASVLRDSKA
jgi:phosphoserine phosphatase